MDEPNGTPASAAKVPEANDVKTSTPTGTLKRRQSSVPDGVDSKRPRLEDSSPSTPARPDASEDVSRQDGPATVPDATERQDVGGDAGTDEDTTQGAEKEDVMDEEREGGPKSDQDGNEDVVAQGVEHDAQEDAEKEMQIEMDQTSPETNTTNPEATASPRREIPSGPSATSPREPRRRSGAVGVEEDKKRGKRLFGALLGTLARSDTSRVQKRREDIERRAQDKLKQQDGEIEIERRRNAEELRASRLREQEIWDIKSKRVAMANTHRMASFLRTKSRPELYYLPWKLLASQRDQIDAQLDRLDATKMDEDTDLRRASGTPTPEPTAIGDEKVEDTDMQGSTNNTVGSNNDTKTDATAKLADSETTETERAKLEHPDSHTAEATEAAAEPEGTRPGKDLDEHDEEMVVDGGEDPVLY